MTRTRQFLFTTVFLFAVSTLAPAQQPPARDAQAVAVVQQAVMAMASVPLNDTVVQATMSNVATGATLQQATFKTLGGDVRLDAASNSMLVSNGRRLGLKDGKWQGVGPPGRNHHRVEHLPVLLLLSELVRTDTSVAYVGEEKVEDQSAHRIRFARVARLGTSFDQRFTQDSELDVLIDSVTGLVLKISYLMFTAQDWRIGIPVEIVYSDYKNLGGVLVPCLQEKRINGNLTLETKITSFAANTGVPASLFEVR